MSDNCKTCGRFIDVYGEDLEPVCDVCDRDKRIAKLEEELDARRTMMRGMVPAHDCQCAEDAYEAGSGKLAALGL